MPFPREDFNEELSETFSARMKRAAGVSEIDEVVNRFSTQEQTATILGGQMNRAETEVTVEAVDPSQVRLMGERKESLQTEWEEVRYLGQDEDMELKERMEEMVLDIEDADERVTKAKYENSHSTI